jgi:hypothetical protein
MMNMYSIGSILLVSIFGFLAFRDWGEMELDWQAKKFKIKRRQNEYLQPSNLDMLADKSDPEQLPGND